MSHESEQLSRDRWRWRWRQRRCHSAAAWLATALAASRAAAVAGQHGNPRPYAAAAAAAAEAAAACTRETENATPGRSVSAPFNMSMTSRFAHRHTGTPAVTSFAHAASQAERRSDAPACFVSSADGLIPTAMVVHVARRARPPTPDSAKRKSFRGGRQRRHVASATFYQSRRACTHDTHACTQHSQPERGGSRVRPHLLWVSAAPTASHRRHVHAARIVS